MSRKATLIRLLVVAQDGDGLYKNVYPAILLWKTFHDYRERENEKHSD